MVGAAQIAETEGRVSAPGRICGVAAEFGLKLATDEEIALTVPVEAFEHYETWLTGVTEAAGMPRFRLIDEPSAAALGYGAVIAILGRRRLESLLSFVCRRRS